MNKLIALCALTLFISLMACTCAAAEAESLQIDADHIYSNMSRPYAQGYSPLVKGDYVYIVLPLLAGEREHALTAELIPDSPEAAPFELVNLTQQFKPRSYSFDGERVRTYLICFRIRLYDDCLDGDYPLTISVMDGGHELRYRVILSIDQHTPNPEMPLLEIVDCVSDLNVGETGELTLILANRSKTRTARDIALTFADAEGYVLPLASDTTNIPDIEPGGTCELSLPVRVRADSPAQPHPVQFNFKFGYGSDKTAEMNFRYTLDLMQKIRINYTVPTLPDRVVQGDVATMAITVMNMGRGKIINTLLTPDMPGLSSGGSVLLGNIEPGASASGSVNFRVGTDILGQQNGTIEIYCEDEYGNVHTQEVPISTTVNAPPETDTINEAPVNESRSTLIDSIPWWLPWLITCMMAVALICVIIWSSNRVRTVEEQRL